MTTEIHPARTGVNVLNNFRHDLSTMLMPQTFEGFNDLCTKAHDIVIHLNKRKRSGKESGGKIGQLLFAAIASHEKALYGVRSSSHKYPYVTKPGEVNPSCRCSHGQVSYNRHI